MAKTPTTTTTTAQTQTPKTSGLDISTWKSEGRNVRHITLDGILFVAIKVDQATLDASPMSGSGKSKSVGTTLGNVSVGNIKLGVNAYLPNA